MQFISGEISILKFDGEIIFEKSNDIKNKAKELLAANQVDKVIIDLENVPYLDSSGIGVVISLFKNVRERQGELVVAAPTEKVEKVIRLTMLDQIIKVYADVEEAKESMLK